MRILGIVVLGAALVPVGALGQINDDVAAPSLDRGTTCQTP
jgi:hypothetical protein